MIQVLQQAPKISKMSWSEHIAHGHVPFRRDCLVCQQSLQQRHPHRRIKHPQGGVLSLDTVGPLKKATDVGSYKAKYVLVGAFTWILPQPSDKLQTVEEDPEVGEDAPRLEEEERRGRSSSPRRG